MLFAVSTVLLVASAVGFKLALNFKALNCVLCPFCIEAELPYSHSRW